VCQFLVETRLAKVVNQRIWVWSVCVWLTEAEVRISLQCLPSVLLSQV
jgi:hypothetical protein